MTEQVAPTGRFVHLMRANMVLVGARFSRVGSTEYRTLRARLARHLGASVHRQEIDRLAAAAWGYRALAKLDQQTDPALFEVQCAGLRAGTSAVVLAVPATLWAGAFRAWTNWAFPGMIAGWMVVSAEGPAPEALAEAMQPAPVLRIATGARVGMASFRFRLSEPIETAEVQAAPDQFAARMAGIADDHLRENPAQYDWLGNSPKGSLH